jgi:hypothetical protein
LSFLHSDIIFMYSECMPDATTQPAPPISTDIVIPTREMSKSAQTLPEFLREEALHIVRTGKSFHFDRKHLYNGLIHLSFFAGFLPFDILSFLLSCGKSDQITKMMR